jgi:cell wall-associated NlpC family hydrolase
VFDPLSNHMRGPCLLQPLPPSPQKSDFFVCRPVFRCLCLPRLSVDRELKIMNRLSFTRRLVILTAVLVAGCPARADNDNSFTGTTASPDAPVKKSTAPAAHKAPVKRKHPVSTMTSPPVSTNQAVFPSTPAIFPDTNAPSATPPGNTGRVATLALSDLRDYDTQPLVVQKLLASGLALTTLNLPYRYGSSDPKDGGMDCSGTVYYLLRDAGIKDVPRDASEMYRWAWKAGLFQAVVSSHPDTFELERLKPGDLLFWTGTYRIDRDPPVTHVMIYLGVDRHTGARVMVGASEGRRFEGISRYGVSVFDFTLPGAQASSSSGGTASSDQQSRFIGYAPVPGLEELEDAGKPAP